MASCTPLEAGPGLWADLKRLRDISRLVLVALAKDDLESIEDYVNEGDELLQRLQPLLVQRDESAPELRSQLEDIVRSNRQIVDGLRARKDEVSRSLAGLRATRGSLRALRLRRTDHGGALDLDA